MNHTGPWWDHIDWWTSPALAYAKGLADGRRIGRDEVDAELVAALAEALGGPGCVDYRDGVARHLRAVDARARRRQFDRGEHIEEQAA